MGLSKEELRKEFAADWKKHYQTKTLSEAGFGRRQCKKCAKHFWSIEERDVCADASCIGYEFLQNPPSGRKLSYVQTWKEIEKYFVKHGHTSVKPYPTVARWRDDLYFTIASINDFQPYVVSGEIEPPANPLIVPQTCIRFSDISNVGVTGRHYTNFVMVGQHAFNNKKTGQFYWKDEALMHDMGYMDALGIKKERLVFVEDVWMGGGNFGPCIEYFCGGLELGNCVFMQYEVLPGGKSRELSNKVIDMGAGLARFAWVTHSAPTSYEIVFGDVVQKMKKDAGEAGHDKLFLEFSKHAGGMGYDEVNLPAHKEKVAQEMGMEMWELYAKLSPLFSLYAAADHLSTLLFTITDGMLPSNAGGGYNLRMIARRTFGADEKYALKLDYGKIIEGHARHLHPIFPHLKEGVQTTIDVVEEERKKYRATQEKGRGKVLNMLNRHKKEGKPVGEGELLVLYQSDGIPAEMVAQVAGEAGMKVEVPADFYSRACKPDEEEKEEKKPLGESYPNTEMLCYNTEIEFDATVIGVEGKCVVLDRSAFYPESGGQVSDTGFIEGKKVLDAQKHGGVILHEVENASSFKKGQKVRGKIIAQRRKQIMQHHSGAHVLNAAAREVLGMHVWQGGSHKDEQKAHLDLTHYRRISEGELCAIEKRANEIIAENMPVHKKIYHRSEAESKFSFRIYQGGAVPGKELRIVSIGDIDNQACGGTHVDRTGDIGMFKIVKREGIQDGIERVTFKCGNAAVKHVQERERLLKEAADALSVPEAQLAPTVTRFFNEWKERGKKIEGLTAIVAQGIAKGIVEESEKKGGAVEKEMELDADTLKSICKAVMESKSASCCVWNGQGEIFCAAGKGAKVGAGELLNGIAAKMGGSGGGGTTFAQGRIGKR